MAISVDNGGIILLERDGTRKAGIPTLVEGDEIIINLDANGVEKSVTMFDVFTYLEVTIVASGAVGWIYEDRIVRNYHFVEPVATNIDKDLFSVVTLAAARVLGVNLHYLLALAHLRSGITDFRSVPVAGTNDERCIGPYAFSISSWNKYKTDHLHGINFLERSIFDPLAQPWVTASRIRSQIDTFSELLSGASANLNDLYFWALLPETAISAVLKAPGSDSLKVVLQAVLGTEQGIGDAAAAIDGLIKKDRDFFLDGETPRTVEGARKVAEQRIAAALAATASLIDRIPKEEFPGPPAAPSAGATDAARLTDVLMQWGENEYVNVYGHLVVQLQRALNNQVLPEPRLDEDLVWGKNTAEALNTWLVRYNKPKSGTLTFQDWRTLTNGVNPDLFDLCAQVTASFEGHGFHHPVLNIGSADSAILTWGYVGFTFRWGHIQEILKRVDAKEPEILTKIADNLAPSVRQMLTMPLDAQRIWAGQNLVLGGALAPSWKKFFEDLGNTPEVQSIQIAYAREMFWDKTVRVQMQDLGLSEPLSHALLYDIAVQNGGLKDGERAKLKSAISALPSSHGEEKIRSLIVETLLGRKAFEKNPFKEAVRGRKMILVTGVGKKTDDEARCYHLGYWGLEPRLTIRETGLDDGPADVDAIGTFTDFEEFFRSSLSETKFIKARQFLFKGNSQKKSGNLNTNPPDGIWRKIVPVAQLLIDLTEHFQSGVTFNSVYRSRAYNKYVGGAPESRHMQFDAVDFTPQNVSLADAYNLLNSWRSGPSPRFRGGLRRYNTFIHVDTRGTNVNW
jgi:lysozyme